MEPLLNIAVSAARQAGDIILRSMHEVAHLKLTAKGSHDVASEVDIKAEQSIIHTIHKAYPSHGILAEESGVRHGEADTVWIIDPLDGTFNYLHQFPFYCISIAVKVKGRIEHAVVYDPLRHECFTASRGRGARLNDNKIRVSKQTQLQSCLLGTGIPLRDPGLAQQYWTVFQALYNQCAGIRRCGAAALELAYVACGRLDGFFKFGLSPWDIAAGSLLVTEAGGLIGNPQGGDDFLSQGQVVAGTPKIFKAVLQTIAPSLKGIS